MNAGVTGGRVGSAAVLSMHPSKVGAAPRGITGGHGRPPRYGLGGATYVCVYSPPPMTPRVTMIPGDGTGPELTEATRRVLEATGVAFDWDVQEAGVDVMETTGTPLPEETLASVKRNKVALKGPITTPIGTGFRSVNVALRHELGLYACLRPCKTYERVRSRYDNVDLVLVRENTEDLYAGIEASQGSAPKYKGQNRVNPTAMILSGKLMLDHLGETDAAQLLERAVADVIREGKSVTYDMKPSRDDPTAVGTSEYADAIIEKLEA